MFKHYFLVLLLGLALCLPLQAATDIYGPINRQDTLWNIAEKLKPSKGVTTQQVMMALYKKNPHAFTVNNISSLRKDAHLLAPSAAEVKQIKRKTAIAMVQRHNQRWKKRRFVKTNAPIPAELKQKLASQDETTDPEETTEAASTTPGTALAQQPENGTADSGTANTQAAQNQPQTTGTQTLSTTEPAPAQLNAQLREVQTELAKTRTENQRLNAELQALKKAQTQTTTDSEVNDQIQVQLDALKHELVELRTILTQKDNHIKVLQTSLKEASAAIKSQHADNMRLYNKLKELSPESVAVAAAMTGNAAQAKPQLELAEVNTQPLTGLASPETTGKNLQQEVDSAGITKVWADEAPGSSAAQLQAQANAAANGVKQNNSVTLGEILNNQTAEPALLPSTTQKAGFSFSNGGPAKVSPIAWAAVLISFIFILFLIVRALLMQNELRRLDSNDNLSPS